MRRLAAVLLAAPAALAGCDLARDAPVDAAPDDRDGPPAWPPPRADLVPPVGSAATLDVATWNLEWFPKGPSTIERVADLVTSLDLDLVVVQEIASVAAWDELVARLPGHGGVLSSHVYSPSEYQKVGVLYREALITVTGDALLFTGSGYAWPRPALLVHAELDGWTFDVIGLHLKAGRNAEDQARRAAAIRDLDAWARAHDEDEVLLLGDYNEDLEPDDVAFAPLLAAPDRYTFRTWALEDARVGSFIPSNALIDHVVTTAGLADEVGAAQAIIPDLVGQLPGYEAAVSDHLPVVLSFPLPAGR